MGGKSGGEIEIYEYTMSIHMGICAAGAGMQLLQLKYGEKEIWRGAQTAAATLAINNPSLFGDVKKEGGVKGLAWWLPGGATQTMPESLAKKLGLTTATCPGFRGLASVFFTGTRDVLEPALQSLVASLKGNPSNTKKGFYWGSNNPYLRALSARVRRPSIGLTASRALIRMPDAEGGIQRYASNPAHMIYECLTDTDWGMGESPTVIDLSSFEAAALTLFNEGFGLNMIWARQSEIGKFIGEILTHIQGALFVHPATGKHTLKLLRADYDVDQLPVIDPGNARLSSFKRKVWGEIANEVVVTWTNPDSNKEATVAAQDLAGIAAQGGVASSSTNYYGVTSQLLAIKLAERDLAASVNPIATCQAEVTREFWDTVSSDVLKLSWPEYNIEQIIFRVSEVEKSDNMVTLSLYEDIFGLDYASYLEPGETQWSDPSQPPQPASYYQAGTAPAFMMAKALGLTDPSELEYPESMSSVTVGADSDDDVKYDLVSNGTNVNGTLIKVNRGDRAFCGTWVLLDGLVSEATTVLPTLPGLRGPEPVAGNFILIGMGADEYTEIATVQTVDGNGYRLNRGMLDTVPQDWPAGTRAFVIPSTTKPTDATIRSVSEDVSYWLLPRTTSGALPIEDAPQINVSISGRPHWPNRPANVKVNSVGFGTYNATGLPQLSVTWANRNRTLESTQVSKWADANVAGETDQRTKITVSKIDGTPLIVYPAVTGTSFTIPASAAAGNRIVDVKVKATRGNFESLQGHTIRVRFDEVRTAVIGAQSTFTATRTIERVRTVGIGATSSLSTTGFAQRVRALSISAQSNVEATSVVGNYSAFSSGFSNGFQ